MWLSSRGGIKDGRENNKHLIWAYPGYQRHFLACDEELRWPAADTSSAKDRRHERRSREKKPLAQSALISLCQALRLWDLGKGAVAAGKMGAALSLPSPRAFFEFLFTERLSTTISESGTGYALIYRARWTLTLSLICQSNRRWG